MEQSIKGILNFLIKRRIIKGWEQSKDNEYKFVIEFPNGEEKWDEFVLTSNNINSK